MMLSPSYRLFPANVKNNCCDPKLLRLKIKTVATKAAATGMKPAAIDPRIQQETRQKDRGISLNVTNGTDPAVIRSELKNALPRAPKKQLYNPVMLHTSFARLLGRPRDTGRVDLRAIAWSPKCMLKLTVTSSFCPFWDSPSSLLSDPGRPMSRIYKAVSSAELGSFINLCMTKMILWPAIHICPCILPNHNHFLLSNALYHSVCELCFFQVNELCNLQGKVSGFNWLMRTELIPLEMDSVKRPVHAGHHPRYLESSLFVPREIGTGQMVVDLNLLLLVKRNHVDAFSLIAEFDLF
eukprot:Gb_05310 [translate_table: standard]